MNRVHPPETRFFARRKWLLRGLTILVALLPFVMIEMAFRWFTAPVAGAAAADAVVDLQQLRPLLVLDASSERWQIPPSRGNFFQPDSFLAEKPAGSRRVFVLGGSTVQGRPYSTETSLSSWLRLRLQANDPETQFEVINCGGVSYASYRVAKILEEVLDHQPDAIVIYTGHNEFLEDREYGDLFRWSAPRRWLDRVAANIRTVTWLKSKLQSSPAVRPSLPSEVDARLDHAGGLDRYRRDPHWRAGVEQHFALALQQMVTLTRDAGVPLVLCVPTSDLVNTPPFKVEPLVLEGNRAEVFAAQWAAAQSDAAVEQRLSATRACLEMDPEHAGANYVAGRLHYDRQNADLARKHLTAARDFDVRPLRATTPIVNSVIEIAGRNGIPLVRTDRLLDQRDSEGKRIPDGIADPEFFVDHLHPTIVGHQLIGAEIANELERLGWFSSSDEAQSRYERLAQEHLAGLGEAYYARGKQRLEGLRRWAAGRAAGLVPVPADPY